MMTPRKWWSVAILNKRRSWSRWFATRVEQRRFPTTPATVQRKG